MDAAADDIRYRARLRHGRIAPRKVRAIADLIRNQPVPQAQATLHMMNNRGAAVLLKLVNSAVANARHANGSIDAADLYVSTVTVDQGPPFMKKWRPRAHGRATPIKRLSSHVDVTLSLL